LAKYIYEYKNWTDFTWRETDISAIFGEVRRLQGKIVGQMNTLGFATKEEATLTTLTLDVVKSSEIEGEKLDYDQVRSSIARRIGMNIAGLVPANRNVEGVVEMMLDATQNYQKTTDQQATVWLAFGPFSHRAQRNSQNRSWTISNRGDANCFRCNGERKSSL
jgi:Fic family protein